jgi:hypothetical protein
MTAASPASMMSRVVRMPASLWTTTEFLKLDDRETKTLTLSALTNLPANSLITVRLSEATQSAAARPPQPFPQRGMVALSFSTVTNVVPRPQPNLTVAR